MKSNFDDQFQGAGGNRLVGGFGDDQLNGGAGADLLIGGDGIDIATYDLAQGQVGVNLADPSQAFGEAAGDVYVGIKKFRLSNFNDVFVGSADVLDGGAGNDAAEYGDATSGVSIDLTMAPSTWTGDAQGDTLISSLSNFSI